MAFRCRQNIHIIKYEIKNTNIIPKGVNESNCINTKAWFSLATQAQAQRQVQA